MLGRAANKRTNAGSASLFTTETPVAAAGRGRWTGPQPGHTKKRLEIELSQLKSPTPPSTEISAQCTASRHTRDVALSAETRHHRRLPSPRERAQARTNEGADNRGRTEGRLEGGVVPTVEQI